MPELRLSLVRNEYVFLFLCKARLFLCGMTFHTGLNIIQYYSQDPRIPQFNTIKLSLFPRAVGREAGVVLVQGRHQNETRITRCHRQGCGLSNRIRKQQPIDLGPRSAVCMRLGWGKGDFGKPKHRGGQAWMLALRNTFILDETNS